MKKPLIILTGPTAAGKTELSLSLAKKVKGEIISADSMQVYRHMDIGSAKIQPEEMQGIAHHLIDILEPDEEFHVVKFQKYVLKCMEDIYSRGHIPILTGGTGFYIQAILYGINFTDHGSDEPYRMELEDTARKKGNGFLHAMLKNIDEDSAKRIHPNNVKRVIRALEYYHETGEAISKHNEKEREKESPYEFAYFVLNDQRERLYQRINERVDQMIKKGLVEEVRLLYNKGYTKDMVSMQGIGYKEILSYFEGDCSLEEAISMIKRDTRHFAKRQITWFKREKQVYWIDKSAYHYDNNKILEYMEDILGQKGILGGKKNVRN